MINRPYVAGPVWGEDGARVSGPKVEAHFSTLRDAAVAAEVADEAYKVGGKHANADIFKGHKCGRPWTFQEASPPPQDGLADELRKIQKEHEDNSLAAWEKTKLSLAGLMRKRAREGKGYIVIGTDGNRAVRLLRGWVKEQGLSVLEGLPVKIPFAHCLICWENRPCKVVPIVDCNSDAWIGEDLEVSFNAWIGEDLEVSFNATNK